MSNKKGAKKSRNPKFAGVVSSFMSGETLSQKYMNEKLKQLDRYDFFVDGELLTDEAVEMMLTAFQKLDQSEVVDKLDNSRQSVSRQRAVVKELGALFNVYLRGFVLTKAITNVIELELLVTSPFLRKQGVGGRLITQIKGQGKLVFANASNCLNADQFRKFFLFLMR